MYSCGRPVRPLIQAICAPVLGFHVGETSGPRWLVMRCAEAPCASEIQISGSPERDEETQARHAAQVDVGYDSHLLTPDEVRARFPGVAARRNAVSNPGEGWVSLPHLLAHLAEEFTAAGGLLRSGDISLVTLPSKS